MPQIDPHGPGVVWRRAYKVGTFDASTGRVDITQEMLDGSLRAFEACRAKGVLPAVVYDHEEGPKRIPLGHVAGLEKRADGWVWAGLSFVAPPSDPALSEFVTRTAAAFEAGSIAGVSIEARFGVSNVAYYGEWVAPMEITAVAVLPPGDFPAIPGAGGVAASRGTALRTVAFRVSMDGAAGGAGDVEKERKVEEKLAALASRVETVEKGIDECKAGIAKLVGAEEAKAKAAEEAAKAAETAKAASASDETVKASRAKLDGRMVAGQAEKVDASLKALDSPAAKLAVLATLDAVLPAKLEAGTSGEKLDAKGPDGKPAASAADPGTEYVQTVMARDKVEFPAALLTACREKPELYGEAAKPADNQ